MHTLPYLSLELHYSFCGKTLMSNGWCIYSILCHQQVNEKSPGMIYITYRRIKFDILHQRYPGLWPKSDYLLRQPPKSNKYPLDPLNSQPLSDL